ncbi:hypothetical protein [Psychrobacter ciconiae]|uniref:hypothetical protein n=1 Tax=Psychrobacter ciconiae TaxID=1553449 RepID=UPI001919A007|nr:hypothetical protein [Psychrobacter ciconiae]
MGRNQNYQDTKVANKSPSTPYQRRQASVVLWRIQWLIMLLLILALIWLMVAQSRFEQTINERLQSNEQLTGRLNDMDDRLFAISQQALPEPQGQMSNQAQNQLDLLKIQIQAATRLLEDNNLSATIELLRGLQWQLSQSSNEIAPALTIVIKNSLTQDIERLQAQSLQTNPWQRQNLAIQNIQRFLHQLSHPQNATITQQQLIIHEVIMTLNLAIQASNLHHGDEMVSYLQQSRDQLSRLQGSSATTQNSSDKAKTVAKKASDSLTKNDADRREITANHDAATKAATSSTASDDTPTTLPEAMARLDELIANKPVPITLVTAQMLNQKNAH